MKFFDVGSVLINGLVGFLIGNFLIKYLELKSNHPGKYQKVKYLGVAGAVVSAIFSSLDLDLAFNEFLLILFLAVLWYLFSVTNTEKLKNIILWSAPLILIQIADIIASVIRPSLQGEIGDFSTFGIFWLIGFGIYLIRQKNKDDKVRLAEEAERLRLEKQNSLLETLVKERTNEIQNQHEALLKSMEQLKTTQAQLIQSEKMASLGELTAGIAHEIQNPLNFVNNFSEVNQDLINELKEEQSKPVTERDDKLIEEILRDIQSNSEKINFHGHRAANIVKSMLDHSRKSTGQKEPTDINELCDEYIRLSYHGLRAKDQKGSGQKMFQADFKLDLDPTLPSILAIKQDIGRILLNLINNAFYAVYDEDRRASENGRKSTYIPTVIVRTKSIKNNLGMIEKVEIRVMDNGAGIPDAIKDKIFQPFFTTKPTGQGTGLGLSLAYDIVTKAHNGELRIEDTDTGACFVVVLPVK